MKRVACQKCQHLWNILVRSEGYMKGLPECKLVSYIMLDELEAVIRDLMTV